MKKEINVFDYTNHIMNVMPKGILITTKADDKVNTMAIGWGQLGIEWGSKFFIAYVRESRFTHEQLEKNPEFTINIPLKQLTPQILKTAGTKSGRNIDKIKELDLTLVDSDTISVPGIREVPITLECKVIYKHYQDPTGIGEYKFNRYYPQDVEESESGKNKYHHTVYYGEISAAYIIE